MKSDDKNQQFHRNAKITLAQYDISNAKLVFLDHSENITFRVESQEQGKFLLRIHQPVSEFRNGIWQKREIIRSELLWLKALHCDTDIVVQEPILFSSLKRNCDENVERNLSGDFVTEISFDGADEPINCTLLRWIDGEHIDNCTQTHATQLGSLVARLHQHTYQWVLPQGFTRPKYDWDELCISLIKLRQGVNIGTISMAEYVAFETALDRIQPVMTALGEGREVFGLIHADLHSDNYLVHSGEIRPLDFSYCGFGHYLYEVSDTIRYLPSEYYSSFLRGYQSVRQLPDEYQNTLEAFFIAGMARNFAFLALNPDDYEDLSRGVRSKPNSVNWCLRKYLEDEPFLFN